MCVMRLRGCECDGGCEYDCGLWMWMRLWWVSWQCVCQTKHTVRPENTPESDTCLKVKFNLIKISAQAKTLRGSVYILLLQETRVEMIYGTHAERGKHTQGGGAREEESWPRSWTRRDELPLAEAVEEARLHFYALFFIRSSSFARGHNNFMIGFSTRWNVLR